MKAKRSLISAVALVLITSYLNVAPAFAQVQGMARMDNPRQEEYQLCNPRQGGNILMPSYTSQGAPDTQFCDPWGCPNPYRDKNEEGVFGWGIDGQYLPRSTVGGPIK